MNKETQIGLIAGFIITAIVLLIGSQTLAWIAAIMYGITVLGIPKLMKLDIFNKFIPVNIFTIIFTVVLLLFAAMGWPTMPSGLSDIMPDDLSTGNSGVGDAVIHPNYGNNGTDFAASGTYYLLQTGAYVDEYEMLQVYIDEGASGLIGPDGGVAQSATVSSGDVTFSDYEAYDGELLTVGYIFDSTPAAADWPAMLFTDISVVEVDDDDSDNNHKLSGSSINIWRLGALDSYDWEGTDRAGYKYKATTTTTESNKMVEFYARPTTEGDEIPDIYYYVETDTTFDANVDFIEIAGTIYNFGAWIDINDAAQTWTEAKESKQSTTNYLYAVASVPVQRYVSSTAGVPDDKGQARIKIQYDVPSMAVNTSINMYVYGVPQGAGGSDMHYSAAANPLFELNVTTQTGVTSAFT